MVPATDNADNGSMTEKKYHRYKSAVGPRREASASRSTGAETSGEPASPLDKHISEKTPSKYLEKGDRLLMDLRRVTTKRASRDI
jgi:hypothetical protein